jgi:hypothetical protein
MCTYVTASTDVRGSGLGRAGWFTLNRAVVYFDHPQDAPLDHALCVDFGDRNDPTARVAVELDAISARRLAETILATLDDPDVKALA